MICHYVIHAPEMLIFQTAMKLGRSQSAQDIGGGGGSQDVQQTWVS